VAEPRLLRYSSEAMCHALHTMWQSFVQRFSEGSSSSSDTVETISTTEHYVLVCVALLLRCLQVCGCSAAATLQCVACNPKQGTAHKCSFKLCESKCTCTLGIIKALLPIQAVGSCSSTTYDFARDQDTSRHVVLSHSQTAEMRVSM
jgi:hypothetical protein